MGGNLPDDVSPSDIDYPYGRPPAREPDGYCPHCRSPYTDDHQNNREVEISHDGLRSVVHHVCPTCNNVMEARLMDRIDMYLESWRTMADELERTIDSYTELKQFD